MKDEPTTPLGMIGHGGRSHPPAAPLQSLADRILSGMRNEFGGHLEKGT